MKKFNILSAGRCCSLHELMSKVLITTTLFLLSVLMPMTAFSQDDTRIPRLEIFCAEDEAMPGCTSQDEVDAAFAQWLTGFYYTGGCGGMVESGLDGLIPPSFCGGSVTVIYNVYDNCNQNETCTATFAVDNEPVLAICPADVTMEACSTQDEVDAAFAQWLDGFTYEGGCDGVIEGGNEGSAPSYCGGSVTINYSVYDDCSQDDCSATFSVDEAPELSAICPGDLTLPSCSSQDDVNAVFEEWLNGFTYDGGCFVVEDGLDVSAPSFCGGSVTVNYSVSGDCDQSDACSSTFNVDIAPELSITCPEPVTIPSCSTQDEVDAAFDQWLSGFSYDGGCNAMASGLDGANAPSYCGGEVIIEYNAYDDCQQTASCSSTFSVEAPDPIEVTCAENTTIPGCASQDEVDAAFAAWLADFSYTGGCNAVEEGLDVQAPNYCGGSVTVNYIVSGDCEEEDKIADCSATFTVTGAPALEAICPGDLTIPSCSSQDDIDAVFAQWLAGFTYEGGCDDAMESGNTGDAPSYCGGEVTINYMVYDNCSESACSSTFSVEAPDPIEVTCAESTTIPGCASQDEVDEAFAAWLTGFTYTGGCNAVESGLDVEAPSYCGGSVSVEYTVTGDCETDGVPVAKTAICVATFTVTGAPALEAICPGDMSMEACSTQDEVDAAFAQWLAGFTYEGGCDDAMESGNTGSAPSYCGGEVTINYMVYDNCSESTCSSTFSVDAPDPIEVTCAEDVTIPGCVSQDEVDAAFAEWLADFSYTGGCNAVESGLDVEAPSYCGGSVTITYAVSGDCEEEGKGNESSDCVATFTVTGAPALEAICPGDLTIPSCSSQDDIDAVFAQWLAGFTYEGGCDDAMESGNTGDAPSYCGGEVTINYMVYDNCSESACSSTFSVEAPDPIEVTCAESTTIPGCVSQDEVDEAFAAWLTGFSYTGGCNAVEEGLDVEAPSYCGGSVTVEYTVTGDCETDEIPASKIADCSATFTVTGGPALEAICPEPLTLPSCSSQDLVDAEFAEWLSEFTYAGGCVDAMEDGNTGNAPSYCGGEVTINYTVYDNCSESACSSTFSVEAPDPIEVTCAESTTIPGCVSQDEVDAAFAAWLEDFSYTGGCNAVESGLDVEAPSYCGGSVTVEYAVSGDCEEEVKVADCIATFTVTGGPALEAICPGDLTIPSCSSQDDIDAVFTQWLAGFTYEGGCDDAMESGNTGNAPSYCGGEVTINYMVYDNCSESACSSTFSVEAPDPIEVTCAESTTIPGCVSQDELDEAFAAWLTGFTYTGGCNAVESGLDVEAPSYCGGSVTVEYAVSGDCEPVNKTANCIATFTVTGGPALEAICPEPLTLPSCSSQDLVDAEFAEWLSEFTYAGGCVDVMEDGNTGNAPSYCGGAVTINYLVYDNCSESACSSTFEVLAPDPIEVTCADDLIIPGCLNQDEVNDDFAAWLAGFSYTGGCNAVESGLDVEAPSYCGGSVTVEYAVSGDCEPVNKTAVCSATFTVTGAPAIDAMCPGDMTMDACSTQDAVDAAFAQWLAGFTYEGGCDDALESGLNDLLAPSYCGGSVTVDYYVYDNCSDDGCSATFSVEAPDPIEVTCAESTTIPGCASQDEVDEAFAAWLAGFSYTGGCNAVESGLDVEAPGYCGGSVTVEYSVSGDCEPDGKTTVCSATFTVTGAPAIDAMCPGDMTMDACSSQDAVDAAFAQWLAGFTYEGGCDDALESGLNDLIAPSYCGGSVTVDYYVYDNCSDDGCSATFSVEVAPELLAICPTDMTMDACPTQGEVDAAFALWLEGFGYEGGCGAEGTVGDGDAPPYCGGSVTIGYSVVDNCDQTASCSATFSVTPAEELVITCPDDLAMEGCPTEDEVEEAFDAWYAEFSYTGGCNAVESFVEIEDKTIWNERVIEYTVTDDCGQSETCTATFGWGCEPTAAGDPIAVEMSAYPNPSVQGNIVISFELPVSTQARLEVFDITGNVVAILYDAIAPENTVIQETLNASVLPPGMYYYRLIVKSDLVEPVTVSKLIVTK